MIKKLEILVVEDQPKHLADVKAVLEDRRQYGTEADYVSTLDGIKRELKEKKYDGILSDVFFPEKEGGEEAPSGLWVAEYGIQNGVPFVLVTSTYHHGSKTEPIHSWLCYDKGLALVDLQHLDENYQMKDSEGESGRKNWKGGFLSLMFFIEGVKQGLISNDPDNFGKPVDRNAPVSARSMTDRVNAAHIKGTLPSFERGFSEVGRRLAIEVFERYGRDLYS
ncbi:hypothetical protein J4449_04320 [Candidatus Woesearchaeota archaeon]|nr:hypothetical protein [Candidatus Woesearchaeota archaeon]